MNVEYERTDDRVVATLHGADSQVYTKIAKKLLKIEAMEAEIKQLKAEVKQDTKDYVAGLFEPDDSNRTRILNTVSYVLTLSKDPKPTCTVQYTKVFTKFQQYLSSEQVFILNELKEEYTTVTQKEPSLKITGQMPAITAF